MTPTLEKVLSELKEAHRYEISQTDSFTNQAQLLFVSASVILGTSFLSIQSSYLLISIWKLLIFIVVLFALFFAIPYFRIRKYSICPEPDDLLSFIQKENNADYDAILEWLIKVYRQSYMINEKMNLKRERDFRKSSILLGIAAILLFALFTFNML